MFNIMILMTVIHGSLQKLSPITDLPLDKRCPVGLPKLDPCSFYLFLSKHMQIVLDSTKQLCFNLWGRCDA